MNEVSTVVNAQALGAALSSANRPSVSGDSVFMKMSKAGEWIYGSEELEVQGGSLWAVNPQSFMEGYIAWGEGEVLGEEMAPMTGAPILPNQLPDTGALRGWEKQIGFQLVCLNGEDEGTQVLYKVSSKGGMKAVRGLIQEVVTRIGVNPATIVPHVRLENDSYKHKKYGKIYTPVFGIVNWSGIDAGAAAPAAPAETAETAAPAAPAAPAEAAEAAETASTEAAEPEAAPRRRRPIAS